MGSRLAVVVFSAFCLNLLLCFGIGIREMVSRERSPVFHIYYPWGILFVATSALWLFFERILAVADWFPGFLLIYPLSLFSGFGLETALFKLFPRLGENPGVYRIGSGYNGFSLAALFLTMQFAVTFGEALLFSLAFSGGAFIAYLIIKEIQKRSFGEAIPHSLRGNPLLLISMGLLSLIFYASAMFVLKVLLK
jgi:Na+-translocating ferredoxin:NAD+ oxidoreductase RnfA subunit